MCFRVTLRTMSFRSLDQGNFHARNGLISVVLFCEKSKFGERVAFLIHVGFAHVPPRPHQLVVRARSADRFPEKVSLNEQRQASAKSIPIRLDNRARDSDADLRLG